MGYINTIYKSTGILQQTPHKHATFFKCRFQCFFTFHGQLAELTFTDTQRIDDIEVDFTGPDIKYGENAVRIGSASANRDDHSFFMLFNCRHVFAFTRPQGDRSGQAVGSVDHQFHLARNRIIENRCPQDQTIGGLEYLIDGIHIIPNDTAFSFLDFVGLAGFYF